MPTLDELASIFNPKVKNKKGYHITNCIDLSDIWLWASETRNPWAATFGFGYGGRYWNIKSHSSSLRALPVRDGEW